MESCTSRPSPISTRAPSASGRRTHSPASLRRRKNRRSTRSRSPSAAEGSSSVEKSARHAAEYVHLRDPRGAGFEPETLRSGYKWDLGIGWYEEVRDSGANFFFEWLPAGEYTFRYRLRAATAGTFRVGPDTLQSMYAPEFAAYSAGDRLAVE